MTFTSLTFHFKVCSNYQQVGVILDIFEAPGISSQSRIRETKNGCLYFIRYLNGVVRSVSKAVCPQCNSWRRMKCSFMSVRNTCLVSRPSSHPWVLGELSSQSTWQHKVKIFLYERFPSPHDGVRQCDQFQKQNMHHNIGFLTNQ